jgi:hypothetical protein
MVAFTEQRKIAFICRSCGGAVGDPAYCGPWGHAPQDVCFSCWLEAFEQSPRDWPRQVLALWLIANGYTRAQAARRCGVTERTARNWMIHLRKNREEFLELISGLDEFCAYRRLKEGQ